MCAVPNMAVFCSYLTSLFPGMLLRFIIIIIIIIIIINFYFYWFEVWERILSTGASKSQPDLPLPVAAALVVK